MQDLNEFIEHKYFENQKIEDKSKAVEARISALEGFKKEYLLARNYGAEVNPLEFGLTARDIIVRKDKTLAGYMGFDLSYWDRKEQEELEMEEYIKQFQEKTEALRQQTLENKLAREKRTIWNQTHGVDQRRF